MSTKSKIFTRDDLSASDRLTNNYDSQLKDCFRSILAEVDLQINGDRSARGKRNRPWDMPVHHENLYQKVIRNIICV